MDLLFCGTPQFAVPTLQALVDAGHNVRLVVTQPDRPSGRGMELAAPPVKQLAQKLALPITQPDKIRNNAEFRAQLEALALRAIIVVGYGRIIPDWMLALPPLGNINLHASLLPKYRGAAPIQWAIANGETVTGNTTMRIDAGLDTGDILLQQAESIAPDDTALTLAPRLAQKGAALIVETLRGLETGTITPRAQDNASASLAPILEKEDGQIDFNRTAQEILNRLRGFQPWPGAFTTFCGKKLNVWEAAVTQASRLPQAAVAPASRRSEGHSHPGQITIEADRLFATCGQDTELELLTVQPEGKKRMTARDFINGYKPKPGETLGQA